MLSLRQSLSLNSIKTAGGWKPSDETGLKSWYKFNTGITLNGSDVSAWADSSENSFDMVQTSPSKQPAYNSGDIAFNSADIQSLQSVSDIELSGAFTIGIKLNVLATGGVILGDNTINGELFKIFSSTKLRIKIDNTTAVDLVLDSETWGDGYMVVTRSATNVLSLGWNGVAQTTATPTLSGTANIDCIGVRNSGLNPYHGTISEIQIFDTLSPALVANVNSYLSRI